MTGFYGAPERPTAATAPSSPPSPARAPAAPARFAATAIFAGFVAAATLGGNRIGLNALLVAVSIAVAAFASGRTSGTSWSRVWSVFALSLVAIAVVRDAAWVVLPCLLGAAAFASLAMAGGRSWAAVIRGLLSGFERLPSGPPEILRSAAAGLPRGSGAAAVPALRGLVIAAVLIVVFGALFVTGDRAFAELAEGALPGWNLEQVPAQIFWLAITATFCGALVVAAGSSERIGAFGPPRHQLGRVEWLLPLACLNLLFASFVAVQATVLFGRDEHVLRTAGLTYAEYAREGYGQLLAAAALTLAVTAAARRWVKADRALDDRWLRGLLTLLCALTLVVLASALHRLGLYQDAFGATRMRLAAEASMLWLGGMMLVVGAGLVLGHYHWMPRVAVVISGLALLGFAVSDPDRRIAERNIARYAETGRIDVSYLRGLSADAVPALLELPRPVRADAVADQHDRLSHGERWIETNLARSRARDALSE